MEKRKNRIIAAVSLILAISAVVAHYVCDPWGYYWKVSREEAALRHSLVETAESYLGCREADGSHQVIIDLYNTQEVLPRGYTVQYNDSWCSAFVSAMAMESGLTEIIPTECGCEKQIELFQEIGRWVEDDNHIPAPGDLIFYDWDVTKPGESTGWSDHVGIVVGIKWPIVKVIEGNKEDSVAYRIIPLWDMRIRGYGCPDYASLTE